MKDYHSYIRKNLDRITEDKIIAKAEIRGSSFCSCVNGGVVFYRHGTSNSVYIAISIFGIPDNAEPEIYIHDNPTTAKYVSGGTSRAALRKDSSSFAAKLQSNGGFAFSLFYTEKYKLSSIIGKTVSIYDGTDRIGCGTVTFVC